MTRQLLLALFIAVAVLCGCSKTTKASAYGSDNKWWKCSIEPSKGCEGGALEALGLTQEETKYVTEVLDRAPWFPVKSSKEEVIGYFGAPPSVDVSTKLIFEKDAHGLCKGCGVSVYFFDGYLSMIHWYVPNKFLLVRHNPRTKQ